MKDSKEKKPSDPEVTLDYQKPVLVKLGVEETKDGDCVDGSGASGCLLGGGGGT